MKTTALYQFLVSLTFSVVSPVVLASDRAAAPLWTTGTAVDSRPVSPATTGARRSRDSTGAAVGSSLKLTVESQTISRSGPHRFRLVDFSLTNVGTRPVYVYGRAYPDRFQPAGDRLILDPGTHEWKSETSRGGTLTPERIKAEFKDVHTLHSGKSLAFQRSYAPPVAGRKLKADVYCSFDTSDAPIRVATEEFLLQ